MSAGHFTAFLPELVVVLGALALFVICLGAERARQAQQAALIIAVTTLAAALLAAGSKGTLFAGAYQVDAFSQGFKVVLAVGYVMVVLLNGDLPDIRSEVRPEYHLFLTLSVSGLLMLVSCIDVITLVVALQLAAFPLYLMVPMRRERPGQRSQMESAIKYVMFGIAANGVMLFGLSYLFGLTGTSSLPQMARHPALLLDSPVAVAGLGFTLCGLFYKLAAFPFHFWTPDVYQGAAHETAGLVASLPKIGAVAVLVRFVSLAGPESSFMGGLLTVAAMASMFYGNLLALAQSDLKRLLGFSSVAHAGYALIGFVVLGPAGYRAAVFYMVGYLFMVLACFVVVVRVARDGENFALEGLSGLHRRSGLLALTLLCGVFALAGLPPFVGFTAKLTLLTAALAKGHLALVIVAVVNTAIAVYYYLCIVREAFFREGEGQAIIQLDWPTRILCGGLIVGIVALGIFPARVLDAISVSLSLAPVNP
jgi:NADH-quinone oxidoreductase subunit N